MRIDLTDDEWDRIVWWLSKPVPPSPMKALDETILRKIDRARTPSTGPLDIECPSCGAGPGEPCVNMRTGEPIRATGTFHKSRTARWRRTSG